MKVQAVLLRREGIERFDPLSDLIGTDNPRLFNPAPYYTWRKSGVGLPIGKNQVIGAFLDDGLGNYSYVGEPRTSWMINYLKAVVPYLKEGYRHSDFHGLFSPPKTVNELLSKAGRINNLYFGLGPAPPAYEEVTDSRVTWGTSEKSGVEWIRCSADISEGGLRGAFTDLWQGLKPHGRSWLIEPLLSSAFSPYRP